MCGVVYSVMIPGNSPNQETAALDKTRFRIGHNTAFNNRKYNTRRGRNILYILLLLYSVIIVFEYRTLLQF